MNKKIVFLLTLIILVSMTIILLARKTSANEIYGFPLAIMVYDETTNSYVKSDTIPVGSYELNEEKSKCVSGGTVANYDSTAGTVTYSLKTGDECYAYFDIALPTLASHIVGNVYSADGVNNLYLHDGQGLYTNASLEAGDNTYRYSGENPNNYVCFLGDDCTDENNLYRILSLNGTTNQVKLIKYKYAVKMAWSFNEQDTYTNAWEGSIIDAYLNSEAAEYTYLSTKYDSTNNKVVLNQSRTIEGYLYSLGSNANLIELSIWHIGGYPWDQHVINNAKGIFAVEHTSAAVERKVGLMYVSDYMYAASPEYWDKKPYADNGDDYRTSKGNDWLFATGYPWTLSGRSDLSPYVYAAGSSGQMSLNTIGYENSVIPSFVLKSTVKITNSDSANVGTKENPMIIK